MVPYIPLGIPPAGGHISPTQFYGVLVSGVPLQILWHRQTLELLGGNWWGLVGHLFYIALLLLRTARPVVDPCHPAPH